MSTNPSEPTPSRQLGSDSLDCVDLLLDVPGDRTVRPSPPERVPFLVAEREKLARWQAEFEKEESDQDAEEKPDEKNGHP